LFLFTDLNLLVLFHTVSGKGPGVVGQQLPEYELSECPGGQ